jgi:hypothetical protein
MPIASRLSTVLYSCIPRSRLLCPPAFP